MADPAILFIHLSTGIHRPENRRAGATSRAMRFGFDVLATRSAREPR
jgi:hypothetical protein